MDSDCGSEGWALALFIAWNLLSMVSCFFIPRTTGYDLCLLVYICEHVYRYDERCGTN